jgi:RNA polymerase sigma-70 factor (ECF subfamily)
MSNPMTEVLRHLQRTTLRQHGAGLPDAVLLEMFIAQREEACFEALVRRHGPMVLGVCRRILRHTQDAEDAFQATFLVLAQRAASIVPREFVGNWLYGVAYRTALQARRAAVRRKKWETQVKEMPDPWIAEDRSLHELLSMLDQELERLPAKYRVAVVLCHLEGKTRKEAAHELGLPVGTVSGRLTTALRLLAKRLSRHGLAVSSGTLAARLSPSTASASVSASLLMSAVQTATVAAIGQAAAAGIVSANVLALAKGVIKSMFLAKWMPLLAVLMAVALPATGAGLLASRIPVVEHNPVRQEERSPPAIPHAEKSRSDRERLQGIWVAVSGQQNGQELSSRTLQSWGELIFSEGKVARQGGERREGTYAIDPDKQPKEINLFPEMNTWRGLYRFEGTTLKLALRFGE